MPRGDHDWVAPALSLFIALILSVVPLPESIVVFRPDWVAVVLLYWSLVDPDRFGMLTAFWMGLALDTLSGALLGQHAFALLLVVYLSQRFHLRIRVFPISQLTITIMALLGLYELILFWVDGVAGRTVPLVDRWAPVITGTALWLLILVVLERGRQASQARI